MDYSVVIPVYNSSKSLEELFQRIESTFQQLGKTYEVIFVDDYSRDNSWEVLQRIKKSNVNHVKLIQLAKNYGQHNATFCGFKYVSGDYVVTIDDDLQNSPDDISLLINKMEQTSADMVYGIGDKQHSTFRKMGSEIWKKGSKNLDKGLGEGSSFRLIKSSIIEKIISHNQHFIFIDELIYWYTSYIAFTEVQHYKRAKGKTGYTPMKMLQLLTGTTLFYGTWPLKLMIFGGMFFSVISFLLGVRFMYKKLVLGINFPGFTATIVTILFSTSLILLCFGIIGKYIHNIYIALNEKPVYSIKEVEL